MSMSWSSWYALKNYVRSSYWVIPFLAVVFEQITLRVLLFLERHIDWFPVWPFSDGATMSVLQAIISLVLFLHCLHIWLDTGRHPDHRWAGNGGAKVCHGGGGIVRH